MSADRADAPAAREGAERGRGKATFVEGWFTDEHARRAALADPAPAAPASGVEAMAEAHRGSAMLDAMAERLQTRLLRSCLHIASDTARDWIAETLTGVAAGPERDAALSAILARLAAAKADPTHAEAAAPRGVLGRAVRAHLAALDARARHDDEPTPDDADAGLWRSEMHAADREVDRTRAEIDKALAAQGEAGDGWRPCAACFTVDACRSWQRCDLKPAPRTGREG